MVIVKNKNLDIYWTKHAYEKMRFYKLTEQRVRRVLHSPKRIEEGIAPGTIAMMQRAGSQKHPYEIWTMLSRTRTRTDKIQTNTDPKKSRYKSVFGPYRSVIVSAWKYPGITKIGEPLPEEVLRELKEIKID